MAWKVTAMDVRMAVALAQGVGDVAAFCRAQGVCRQTYYKWTRRFERGLDGLRDPSCWPGSFPAATPAEVDDTGGTKASGAAIALFGMWGLASRASFTLITLSTVDKNLFFENNNPVDVWRA